MFYAKIKSYYYLLPRARRLPLNSMAQKVVILDGGSLTLGHVKRLVEDSEVEVELSGRQLAACKKSYELVNRERQERITYGVNTGFGPMASYLLGRDQLVELQYNLVRSHAVGMGDPIAEKFVLSAMTVRLNTLLKGYSGVSENLLLKLQQFINLRIIPVIPEHGSVGASGDLVQLAHIALALIGEGEVFYKGKREQTKNVLKKLDIKPHVLEPKEGLSLINGTSAMTGIAACVLNDSEKLINAAVQSGATALEVSNAFDDSISKELHAVRPHVGQNEIAKRLRELIVSSKLLRNREEFSKSAVINGDVYQIPDSVQEVYSLRCIPQILGPVLETWEKVASQVQVEMNSVTDNPIVDFNGDRFLHGGNFHGDYVSTAMDTLKASMVKLSMLSERRINFFLNKNINKTFPPFLNLKKPGLTLALQGLQFVATSTVANNQSLAFPHATHSIPTNGDNQDVVSMGTDSALMAAKVVENTFIVQAIEMVTLTQAMDVKQNFAEFSKPAQRLHEKIRKVFPKIIEDRVIIKQLSTIVDLLKQGI